MATLRPLRIYPSSPATKSVNTASTLCRPVSSPMISDEKFVNRFFRISLKKICSVYFLPSDLGGHSLLSLPSPPLSFAHQHHTSRPSPPLPKRSWLTSSAISSCGFFPALNAATLLPKSDLVTACECCRSSGLSGAICATNPGPCGFSRKNSVQKPSLFSASSSSSSYCNISFRSSGLLVPAASYIP